MLFKSKHQKLILQCYPPGKGTDKKPNSSELSYLLYYASSRRIKLEKVMVFLNHKTAHDASRNKTGNLSVTLKILSSLIERCSDNLNVFALDVCQIITMALKIKDLALAKLCLETFGALCKNLDSGLFAGDRTFVEQFSTLSFQLIDIGAENARRHTPDHLEWKLIGLIACRYSSHCLGFSSAFAKKLLKKGVPLLVETFKESDSENALLNKLSNDDGHRLSKVLTAKSLNTHKQMEDFENDNVDTDDINYETVNGLKSIFNTNSTNQIIDATHVVVNHNFDTHKDLAWSNSFLEMCTSWVPVQLRFVVLSTLVSRLSTMSKGDADLELSKRYALSTSGLISSRVNMIGLSTSDLIQQILSLKQSLYFDQPNIPQEEVAELSEIYSNCIVGLSSHIYYFDQVPDSIYEIFVKIDSTLELAQDKTQGRQLFAFTKTLLQDISKIFDRLTTETSNIARNHVGLDTWEVSLPLLSQKHASSLYGILSEDQVKKIHLTYIGLFEQFLNYELVQTVDKDEETSGDGEPKFLAPDASDLISKQNNFLSHYLISVDKYIYNNDSIDTEVTGALLGLTDVLAKIFGINFLHNYIPFALHWQFNKSLEDTSEFTNDQIFRDTFAYALLRKSLDLLSEWYPEVDSYATKSALNSRVANLIGLRQVKRVWAEPINPGVPALTTSIRDESDASLGVKDIQAFVSENAYLRKWLNASKPLSLSVAKKDIIDDDAPRQVDSSSTVSSDKHGLGLGNNGDISSIHSGIMRHGTINGNGHANGEANGVNHSFSGYDTTGSEYTTKAPRVSDLKDALSDYAKPRTLASEHLSSPGSILSKQMATHDVSSILEDLDTDDELIIV